MKISYYLTRHKNNIPLAIRYKLHRGGSLLPDGYTKLEYIESTGTQYITTNIKLPYELELVASFVKGKRQLMGQGSSGASYFGVAADGQYEIGSTARINLDSTTKRTLYVSRLVNNTMSLTVEGQTISRTQSGSSDGNFSLFAIGGSSATKCNAKIYHAIFNRDGEKIAEFIPCLDADGEPCMYDVVGQQTYYNAGTGRFRTPFDAPLQMMSAPFNMMSINNEDEDLI